MSQKIKTIKEYVALQKPSGMVWEETGFLEGLTTEDALLLKEKLEEMLRIVLYGNLILKNEITESIILTVVRRAYVTYNHLVIDCMATILYVDSRLDSLKSRINVMIRTAYYTIDVEAEMTDLIAEEVAKLKL
jgi:hypothetical protein